VNPEQLFTHLKKLGASLTSKQILGLAAVFLAVVGVLWGSAYFISIPDYTLLVTDMDAETAASVVSKLKDAKVPYELSDGGRAVRVPAERVDELRLQFASNGLASAGHIGFEIFDRPAFGTTEFLEHVNYKRALEGELARTIGTLGEVQSARVSIAMAKDSLFIDQGQPAKASVLLRLKNPNRPLAPATVRGIASLVAGSVEALRPESVTILDTYGRFLSSPTDSNDTAAAAGLQLDRQRQLERDMSTQVISLLEPVVGSGHVRVNVAAILKTDAMEETKETWDPTSVVRSKATTTETNAMANPLGVAGARANQPAGASTSTNPANPAAAATSTSAPTPTNPPNPTNPATPTVPPPAGSTATPAVITPPLNGNQSTTQVGSTRATDTTNYEISKTTRHVLSPQGQLARLSVAVILDDQHVAPVADASAATPAKSVTKPWDAAGIARIKGLVATAVGLDTQRGDQITVENISFDAPTLEPALPEVPTGQKVMESVKIYGPSTLRIVGVLVVAFFALFGVLRPIARQTTRLPAAPALAAPAAATPTAKLPTVQEMEGQIEAELDAATGQRRKLPVLTKRVAKLASQEPEQLARIVRGWMAEGDR
jgi:flagellar M-ring protein FliF